MHSQEFIKTKKVKSRKKRFVVAGCVLAVFLCLLGTFLYFFYWSPTLRVSEFLINGTKDTEKVQTAILNYFEKTKSFLSPASDRIVFWISRNGEIQSPSFLPSASLIRLTSDFTQKRVTVDITPRVMSGVWCAANQCFVFDANGILFQESPDVSGSLILKIRDENNTPVSLGSSVLSQEEFESMKRAIASLQKNNIPISEIVIQNRELKEWSTIAPNGFSVKFSFNTIPDDLDSVFKGVFERTSMDKLTYIDLRVQNRVYFK